MARLLVPLDPWRYYEMGRIADEPFDGLNLDLALHVWWDEEFNNALGELTQ